MQIESIYTDPFPEMVEGYLSSSSTAWQNGHSLMPTSATGQRQGRRMKSHLAEERVW